MCKFQLWNTGLICSQGASPIIQNNQFVDQAGDGIWCNGGGANPVIRNNLIARSTETHLSLPGGLVHVIEGVGIKLEDAADGVAIVNNTIVSNEIGVQLVSGAAPAVENCIIWDNANQIDGTIAPQYSCIKSWIGGGTHNVTRHPHFEDVQSNDYRLKSSSPCINAGNPAIISGCADRELNNQCRVQRGRIDMGAYEFSCYGDVADEFGQSGANDWVDLGDLNYLTPLLSSAGFLIDPVPYNLVSADMADSVQLPGPDGVIDYGDLNYLVPILVENDFSMPCIDLPCPCLGDLTDDTDIGPPDGIVDFDHDLGYLVNVLAENNFSIDPVPLYLQCADVANSAAEPGPDGVLDNGDVNYLSTIVFDPLFTGECIELP